MQIRRILLRNLHSIRSEVVIDFMASPLVDSGLFAITGDTGAGKTTILDAITLAMYGKVCRNSRPEEVLSHGAEEGLAECDFEAGGRRIRCQWRCWQPKSKKGAGLKTERSVAEWSEEKEEYHIVAERKIKEVDAFVEEVSGLDFERFTRSAMLAQGDFAAFLKAAPKERSELLERITGTEVYSEISKAAMERHNLEKAKLAELVSKREALKVFSKEELAARQGVLKEKAAAAKSVKAELESSKNALESLRQLDILQKRKAASQLAIQQLEEEKTAQRAAEIRLAHHRKTLPLHPTLARLDDKLAEATSLKLAIAQFTEKMALEMQASTSSKLQFEEKKAKLESLKAGQSNAMRLFDEVTQMDSKLSAFAENLEKSKLEKLASSRRINEIETQIESQSNEMLAHQKALEELDNWLKTNAVWASLPQDLPAVSIHREGLRDNIRSQNRLKEELKNLQLQAEQAKLEATKLEAMLTQEKNALTQLAEQFGKIAPDAFSPNRQDLLEKLGRELVVLGEQHKNFSQLKSLNADYRVAISELSALETRLAELRQTELWLDKSLLTAYEESDEWERLLEYRREVYNQQLLLSNYEKDRANLRDGDPCPLCMSVHHPFRQHEVKPFVDEARNELRAAENSQMERQKQRNILLKKHIEVNTQIQQIEAASTGEIAKLELRIEELEARLVALLPGLDAEDFSRSYGDWFVDKLGNFEVEMLEKRAVREQLAKLNGQISALETSVRALENQLKDIQFHTQQIKSSKSDKTATLLDLEGKFAEATTELDRLVGKYGYHFEMESANQMFIELEAKEGDFANNKSKYDLHERQLGLLFQSKNLLAETLTEYKLKFQSLNVQATSQQVEFDELVSKRTALFEQKNPTEEREKLLFSIEAAELGLTEARTLAETAKEALALTKQRLETSELQWTAAKKTLSELEKKVSESLSDAGFETMEALRNAILPMEEAAKIEGIAEQIKLKEAALRQEEKSVNEALEAAAPKASIAESAIEIEEKIGSLEAELQALLQEIGALNQQLQDNELRKNESESILQQIDNQRIVHNRWAAVHDLIGSYDGSKFRKFAQGLTLQKLVQLANTHLENLYGRYFIVKRPGEDLELDIVDSYQADNMRSMMTLSGGESFLVSLSLALGLSDLAGRNANIRSLFIDEGFGTLDDQTLDLAISTLENLQAKGKTIGIISHVKELKERIATQVRVLKKGGGTSVVEVV